MEPGEDRKYQLMTNSTECTRLPSNFDPIWHFNFLLNFMINLWVELQCHSIFEKVFTDFFHKIILGHQPNCTRNLQFAGLCDWVGDIFLFIIKFD